MTQTWLRLPDGLGYVRLDGPRPALRTAGGDFLRLHDVPGTTAERAAYVERVADFARERHAERAQGRWPAGRRRICVAGRGRTVSVLASQVRSELSRLGAQTVGPRAAGSADLVIAIGDRPVDAHREAELAALPPRGTAVLYAHPDDGGFVIHPLRLDGSEATPDQVRRRRLAASPAADELHCWLSSPHPHAESPAPAPGVRALVLARLIGTAVAWAGSDVDAAAADLRRTLRVIHPDLRETSHVVLGFDEPAPRRALA